MTDHNLTAEKEAVDAAVSISRFVNRMGFDADMFIRSMSREHRTLQQSFTRICLAWLWHLSQLEDGYYDLRNEASVKTAKELMKGKDKYVACLPSI